METEVLAKKNHGPRTRLLVADLEAGDHRAAVPLLEGDLPRALTQPELHPPDRGRGTGRQGGGHRRGPDRCIAMGDHFDLDSHFFATY